MIGLVFGLGFVQSFGYWTTNFVEVQRAMASSSISAAQRAPIIGSFPKMFIPFIVIFPGMIAGVLVGQVAEAKASENKTFDYNNSMLYLIRDLLPNGMLGRGDRRSRWPPSWPAWRRTSRPSTRCSPTTCGSTTCGRTGRTTTT